MACLVSLPALLRFTLRPSRPKGAVAFLISSALRLLGQLRLNNLIPCYALSTKHHYFISILYIYSSKMSTVLFNEIIKYYATAKTTRPFIKGALFQIKINPNLFR